MMSPWVAWRRDLEREETDMGTITAHPIVGPAAWHGRDLARSTDWIRPISAGAVAELDAVLSAVKARGLAWRDIRREDFPLPGFGAELAAAASSWSTAAGSFSSAVSPSRAIPRTSCASSTGASGLTWAPRATRTRTAS
jgi:hypothetical protein